MGSDKAWLEALAAGSGVSTLAGGSYGLGAGAYWVQRTHSPGHHQHGGHCPGAGAQYPWGPSCPEPRSLWPLPPKQTTQQEAPGASRLRGVAEVSHCGSHARHWSLCPCLGPTDLGAKERLVLGLLIKLLYLNSKQTKAERRGDPKSIRPLTSRDPESLTCRWGRQARVPEQRLAHAVPRDASPAASLEAEMGWTAPGHAAPGGSGGGRQSGS